MRTSGLSGKSLFGVGVLLLALGGTAQAGTISVQYYDTSNGNPGVGLSSGSSVGAPGAATVDWNPVDVNGQNTLSTPLTSNNLLNDGGSNSGASATLSASNGGGQLYSGTPSSPVQDLYYTYADSFRDGSPISVTINNIPYGSYSLYVYASGGSGRNPAVATQGSTSYYFHTVGDPSGQNPVYQQATSTSPLTYMNYATNALPADYATFSNLSGSSITFTLAPVAYATDPTYGLQYDDIGLAGFQIVSSSAVPEPASLSILALGGCLMLRRTRRRTAL
jgi:hypothetical protein